MRGNILEFIRVVAANIELPEPIVEIGAYQVPDAPYPSDLRPLFAGKTFIGCDARPGPGVDQVEDVHQLSFSNESVGTMILLETLEHVAYPVRALEEVYRVTKPGGFVVASSCMDTPVHEHPADYWRFTPQGFDLVVSLFSPRRVFCQGHPQFPHSVVAVGRKGAEEGPLAILDRLLPQISGTLTQEISPRLAPDPFRPLGADFEPGEEAKYPERMLHVAFDRILTRDEQIRDLRAEVARLEAERDAALRLAGKEASPPSTRSLTSRVMARLFSSRA